METKIYNPASQPKEWLIQHFVVRTKVFDRIFKDIKNSTMKYPEQHYLIQGQRGMGKTTLLLRLKYEIENTPELNSWLIPVFFSEEAYDLTSLSNLWEKLLKYLDTFWNTNGAYYKATDEFVGKPDYEKKCFDLLTNILNQHSKKLIIFFDNFGQLFLDNLKEKEQHRFREILMNCADIRIIGASAIVLHDIHDYSKPFFDFFKIINLEGLNKDETFQLITKLQENSEIRIDLKKSKAKIETLAILTSGVIRTIMLIYEVVLNDQDGSALRDLEIILDRTTPLYKHRIDDLPVQQRKIVDVIAKSWDAISVKDIAQNIREDGKQMAPKLISAQLQQLEKNNVIEKKQTSTKNHLYQVRERFFNIWFLMRNGDKMDKCRVIWLTKFLETWYTDENEFDSFIKEHIEHLKSGKYDPGAALTISEALAFSDKLNILSLDNLLKETSTILSEEQKKSLPDISKQKRLSALRFFDNNQFHHSIRMLDSIINRTEDDNMLLAANFIRIQEFNSALNILNTFQEKDHVTNQLLGMAYHGMGEFAHALKCFDKGQNKDDANLFYLMGECYRQLNEPDAAISYYIKAKNLKNYRAFNPLISILIEQRNFVDAEKYSLEAAQNGKIEATKELLELLIFDNTTTNEASVDYLLKIGLESKQTNVDFYYLKAAFLYSKNDPQNAYACLVQGEHLANKSITRYSLAFWLMLLWIEVYYKKNKDSARVVLTKAESSKALEFVEMPFFISFRIFFEVWDGNYDRALEYLPKYLNDGKSYDDKKDLNRIFLLLLSKKQYHTLLKIFDDYWDLKEYYKPTYYALMYNLRDEYPNIYLKMGKELKQPVKDILEKVEEMAVKYA